MNEKIQKWINQQHVKNAKMTYTQIAKNAIERFKLTITYKTLINKFDNPKIQSQMIPEKKKDVIKNVQAGVNEASKKEVDHLLLYFKSGIYKLNIKENHLAINSRISNSLSRDIVILDEELLQLTGPIHHFTQSLVWWERCRKAVLHGYDTVSDAKKIKCKQITADILKKQTSEKERLVRKIIDRLELGDLLLIKTKHIKKDWDCGCNIDNYYVIVARKWAMSNKQEEEEIDE